MLRAFMFDMDGVIIDSEPIQMMSINEVLSQWGVQLSEEEYIPLVGRRLSDDYAYMKKVYHLPPEYPEFFVQKTEAYGRLIRKNGVVNNLYNREYYAHLKLPRLPITTRWELSSWGYVIII